MEVEWRPFDLRPDLPEEGISLEGQLGRGRYTAAHFQQLKQLGEEVGIHLGARTFMPNSRKSLEAAEWAKGKPGFDCFHRALFRAYFEEGRNIGLTDVIVELAAECGLDGADLREALESRRLAQQVDEQLRWAHALGISGVPTFIFSDRFVLVGAQTYDVFESVVQRLGYKPLAR